MAGKDYPTFDIKLDADNYRPGVLKLLAKIRPEWSEEQIKIETLAQGNLNLMLVCFTGKERDGTAIVVRIFGTTLPHILQRDHEVACASCLSKLGVGPKVYCFFNNGICSEFVVGAVFAWKDTEPFQDFEMSRRVAKRLAFFHCNKTSEMMRAAGVGKGCLLADECYKILERWPVEIKYPELHELFYKGLPPKEVLLELLKRTDQLIKDMGGPIVFCMGDPNHTNFIIKESGDIIFVDYEMCGFRTALDDLGRYLFCTSVGLFRTDFKKLHSPAYIRHFIESYLEELYTLNEQGPVPEEDIRRYCVNAEKYVMTFVFTVILFGPDFANEVTDGRFDREEMIRAYRKRFDYFYEHSEELYSKGDSHFDIHSGDHKH